MHVDCLTSYSYVQYYTQRLVFEKCSFVFREVGTECFCITAVSCSCRPLTKEVRFRSWMSLLDICCGESEIGTGFSQSAAVLPSQFHSASVPHIAFIVTKWRGFGIFIIATGLVSIPSYSMRVLWWKKRL